MSIEHHRSGQRPGDHGGGSRRGLPGAAARLPGGLPHDVLDGAPASVASGYAPQPGLAPLPPTAPLPGYPTAHPRQRRRPHRVRLQSPLRGLSPPADPNTLQAILAGIQGALQGTLVLPHGPADGTEAGLKARALRLAPGMQPEGEQLKQNLTEGQHAVMIVTLQAGKCYSILGYSPPGGVKDLDLNLLAPPFFLTLAGQDPDAPTAPAIDRRRAEPDVPGHRVPLQYKLDVFARLGSGQVAVQLYSKAK